RIGCSSIYVYYVFFFSSRRRHTRFSRDWSSDVCSSDLSYTLKGIQDPVPVCQLEDVNTRIRIHALAARGMSRFVGRQHEIETLRSEERRVGKECRCVGWARVVRMKAYSYCLN